MPEGDATQLGGPNFDDLENAVAAKAEIGPASGSPAARGGPAARPAPAAPIKPVPPPGRDEDDHEFGEEAPTEIFGDLDQAPAPVAAAAPAPSMPASRPPRPPGRSPTQSQPVQMASPGGPVAAPHAAVSPPPRAATGVDPGYAQQPHAPAHAQGFPPQAYGSNPGPGPGEAPYNPGGYAAPYPSPTGPAGPSGPMMAVPHATPNAMPSQPLNAAGLSGGPNSRTLLGAVAQPMTGNYGPNYRVSEQQPAAYPQQYPSQPQMPGQMPGQIPGYSQPYPAQQPSYPSGNFPQHQAVAVEQTGAPPTEFKKKSSIGRDVAIGVAIAAFVLGGFLAVKFFVLDRDSVPSGSGTSNSTIATIRLSLPPGVTAELFVDDKRIGDDQGDPRDPGQRGRAQGQGRRGERHHVREEARPARRQDDAARVLARAGHRAGRDRERRRQRCHRGGLGERGLRGGLGERGLRGRRGERGLRGRRGERERGERGRGGGVGRRVGLGHVARQAGRQAGGQADRQGGHAGRQGGQASRQGGHAGRQGGQASRQGGHAGRQGGQAGRQAGRQGGQAGRQEAGAGRREGLPGRAEQADREDPRRRRRYRDVDADHRQDAGAHGRASTRSRS